MGKWRWTYEACYEVAKMYKSRSEFAKGNFMAYTAAYKKGWLNDYVWFEYIKKPNGYWNYKRCKEEAEKYKSKIEFQKGSHSAYQAALKNGWLDEYTWFINGHSLENTRRTIWTYEKCKEIALTCRTLTEFIKNNKSAYDACYKHNWLDEFTWLKRSNCPYKEKMDNVYAYFFPNLNAVYIGRSIEPLRRNKKHKTDKNSSVNSFACQNNMSIPEMSILESNLSLEEGLEKEDYYVNKYREEGWTILNKARTGKRSGSLGGINSKKWTKSACFKESQKYKTRNEFRKGNGSAYQVALKNGWLDEWFDKPFIWNYNNCWNEAKKYTTLKEFREKSNSAYSVAVKNKWIDKYTWLKKGKSRKKIVVKYSLNGEEIEQYNGISEAVKLNGFPSKSGLINCCLGILQTYKGFIWKYKESEVA